MRLAESLLTRSAAMLGAVLLMSICVSAADACQRLYVDPLSGSDSNGGALMSPLRTATKAMDMATAGTTIILFPGVYSAATNGESFPIIMKHLVHMQGTSALDTTFSGGGENVLKFNPGDDGKDYSNTYYDGFMITDAACAITVNTEFFGMRPTFSNMVLVDNVVGICLDVIDLEGQTAADDLDPDPNPDVHNYIEHRPRIVNLTIVQNGTGVRDRAFEINNGNQTLSYGAAEPAILNCIVLFNGVDFDGVDATDVAFSVHQSTGSVTRIKPGKPPLLVPPPLPLGPADVFIKSTTFDFRLLPSGVPLVFSTFVDAGSQTFLSFHGPLTPIVPVGPCGQRIWDADMEGYCDPRLEGSIIDIGADEMGQLIIAGFIPFTRDFGIASNLSFRTLKMWVNPQPALAPGQLTVFFYTNISLPFEAYLDWAPLSVPGLRPKGTIPPFVLPGLGTLCILSPLGPFVFPMTARNPLSFSLTPSVFRFNCQVLSMDGRPAPALSQISNMQTFQAK